MPFKFDDIVRDFVLLSWLIQDYITKMHIGTKWTSIYFLADGQDELTL